MNNLTIKFLGYDARITYDDYDTYEVLVDDLKKISNICSSLENREDSFYIEYKKKYQLEDGSFLYSKKESYSIDNPTIPQREIYLRKFNNIAKTISASEDVRDEDIQECYTILHKLVNINKKSVDANMTIKDLIEKLKTLPQDIPIVTDGYEGGLDTILDIKLINIEKNKNQASWYGFYEEVEENIQNAVYLLSTRGTRL